MDWSEFIEFNYNNLMANIACFENMKKGALRRQIQILIENNTRKQMMVEAQKPNKEKSINEETEKIHNCTVQLNIKKNELTNQFQIISNQQTNNKSKNKNKNEGKAINVNIESNPDLWNFIKSNPEISYLFREIDEAEKNKKEYTDQLHKLNKTISNFKKNISDLKLSASNLEQGIDDGLVTRTLTKIYGLQQDNVIRNQESFVENIANKKILRNSQKEAKEIEMENERILYDIDAADEDEEDDMQLNNNNNNMDKYKKYFIDYNSNIDNLKISSSTSSTITQFNNTPSSSLFSEYN